MTTLTLIGLLAIAELQSVGPAKVFEGGTGEKITVVFLEPKNENRVLIAFDGVDGEWDGKVIEHDRIVMGDKQDFRVRGQKWVSLIERHGRFEAYPKGAKGDLSVSYSKEASEKTKPADIIARFTAQKEKAP